MERRADHGVKQIETSACYCCKISLLVVERLDFDEASLTHGDQLKSHDGRRHVEQRGKFRDACGPTFRIERAGKDKAVTKEQSGAMIEPCGALAPGMHTGYRARNAGMAQCQGVGRHRCGQAGLHQAQSLRRGADDMIDQIYTRVSGETRDDVRLRDIFFARHHATGRVVMHHDQLAGAERPSASDNFTRIACCACFIAC